MGKKIGENSVLDQLGFGHSSLDYGCLTLFYLIGKANRGFLPCHCLKKTSTVENFIPIYAIIVKNNT